MLRLALVFALLPMAATAASEQMLKQIESRLPFYHIETDVSQLSDSQAAAIYVELVSNDIRRTGDWLRKRQRIRAILRRGADF